YDVCRGPGLFDDGLAERYGVERSVELRPLAAGAAPLTIGFTSFPGLLVRFGTWHVEAFPACGCDPCNEEPEAVAEEFAEQCRSLVLGVFRESLFRETHVRPSYRR